MGRNEIVHVLCILILGQALHGCNIFKEMATPTIGIKIEETKSIPSQVQPGERITFRVRYTVTAPTWWDEQDGQAKVNEAWTITFNNQPLVQLPHQERFLTTGSNTFQIDYTLPEGAADGMYTLTTATTLVEPVKGDKVIQTQANTDFVVQAMCVSITSRKANIRSGPGTTFEVIGIAREGSRPKVVGEYYKGRTLWYKVNWKDAKEAWVSSRVAGTPEPCFVQ